MTFSENLKLIRKEKGITQEELADMLEVSRQAVSKWELDEGYPEVEKLMLLANKLNVSLDFLMGNSILNESNKSQTTGRILITSYDGKSIINCHKITSSNIFVTKKGDPKYALFGIDGSSFWGENSTLLGWYNDSDSIQNEIKEIMHAMK
ncbi:MAG: helix-turn-helix domain-containing protein [Anaerorhabdus sp.]|uniref:helix-turn-helix domain-containing protein n=1 Tax=Anaerorhabdus sp. TaxID=1872524 RepID=UPI003A87D622